MAFTMRMPIPDRIKNAPQLRLGLELYLQAFYDLNTCRPSGWGLMPIPWTATREYAEAFDYDEEQTERLFHHIPVMDAAFREYHSKRKPST